MIYLKETRIEHKLEKFIKNNNIYNEPKYLTNKDRFDKIFKEIDFNDIPNMDDIIYFKFISEDFGYGVFAK